MSSFFISYSRNDIEFVELLNNKIREWGFNVWFDGESLIAGENWRDGIDEGIDQAQALILVITKKSMISKYVAYEWAYALGARRKVIPLFLESVRPHPRLQSIQGIHFKDHRFWDKLRQELQRSVDNTWPTVQGLVSMLKRGTPDDRKAAIKSLAGINNQFANDALVDALSSPLPDVQINAALELGRLKDERGLPKLRELLQNEDIDLRKLAAEAMTQVGGAAIPYLLDAIAQADKMLTDRDPEIIREAGAENIFYIAKEAIKKIDKAGVQQLLNALSNPIYSKNLHSTLITFIGDTRDSQAVPALTKILRDPKSRLHNEAVTALGQIADPQAIPDLLDVLSTDNPDIIRRSAVWALGQIGDKRALTKLRDLIKDRALLGQTAEALGKLKDKESVPALISLLQSADPYLQVKTMWALASIGDPVAIPELAKLLNDQGVIPHPPWGPDEYVREIAAQVIASFKSPEAKDTLEKEGLGHYYKKYS